jgi:hypothetical protein
MDPGPDGQAVSVQKDLLLDRIDRIDREGRAVFLGRETRCDRCARCHGGDLQGGCEYT